MIIGKWYKAEGATWETWPRTVVFLATGLIEEGNDSYATGDLDDGRTCKLLLEDWNFKELTDLEAALL